MHDLLELPEWINDLSEQVIGCAIEVHRTLGPGLLEGIYEAALCRELSLAGLPFAQQVSHIGEYKGVPLPPQRLDLVIGDVIVVELKAVKAVEDAHVAQLVSYIRLTNKPLGLLINFNAPTVIKGTHRRINSAAVRSLQPRHSLSKSKL